MIDFYEFQQILEAKKRNVDMKMSTYTFDGKKILPWRLWSNLPKISPEQKEKLSKLRNKFKRELDENFTTWQDEVEKEKEEVREKMRTGELTPMKNRVKQEKGPKNAPQGKRNAECSRCGSKDKAKLFDINAGKAKCKNCGGYLNLISQ